MPDGIEPALTADEWNCDTGNRGIDDVRGVRESTSRHGSIKLLVYMSEAHGRASYLTVEPEYGETTTLYEADDFFATMALANAALPDDDPRKITREDVAMLERDAEMSRNEYGINAGDELDALAAKLAALLPPA